MTIPEDTVTAEERLAKIKAEAEQLEQQIADEKAAARPKALADVIAMIKQHGLKRDELAAAWRQREYKQRGPRKAKAPALVPAKAA